MTKPAHEKGQDPQQDVEAPVRGPRAGGDAEMLNDRPNEYTAARLINEVLKGQGSVDQLPELMTGLDDVQKKAFLKDSVNKLKAVPGDVALRCLEILGATAPATLRIVLGTSEAVTPAALHEWFARQSGDSLASVDDALFAKLKAASPAKLLTAMPSMSLHLTSLPKHAGFVRWFVETTEPGVCAQLMALAMSPDLAATLDKLHLWSPWIAHLRPTHATVALMDTLRANAIKDPDALSTLNKVISPRAKMTDDQRKADETTHTGDVRTEITSKPTVQSLLEAVAREGQLDTKDATALVATLKKLNASADDLLAVSEVGGVSKTELLPVLLHAPGLTAQHLSAFLTRAGTGVDMLADAKTRKAVRAAMPDLRIQDVLVTIEADRVHDLLVHNDGLASWFLETATAKDLLWFCASQVGTAAKATRLAGAKRGWGWVNELTSLAQGEDTMLRVLAINCPDAKAKAYIRDVLIADSKYTDAVVDKTSQPMDERAKHGQGGRLVDAMEGTGDELFARLGDLEEAKRVKLGQSDESAESIGKRLRPEDFGRAARFLDLTFRRTVLASPGPAAATVAYLDTRPHAEQLATLRESTLVKRAAEEVHANLLVVFPALMEPAVLAGALQRDEHLMRKLIEGSDPDLVVELISRDPVLPIAEKIFDKYPGIASRLPRYKHMTKEARAGIDRLASRAEADSNALYTFNDVKSGDVETDADAREQGKRLEKVEGKTLVEAIESLGKKNEKEKERINDVRDAKTHRAEWKEEREVAEVDALSVLRQHKAEVPALMSDRTQRPVVEKLSAMVDLPPNVAMPWIDDAQLLGMPNALRWWMTYRDRTILLHALATNTQARAIVCGALNSNTMGALRWVQDLPKGGALDEAERKTLDLMRPLVRDADAKRFLFEDRFGFPSPTEYDGKTLDHLWDIVARLPPGHILQERIKSISAPALKDEATGMYGEGSGSVMIDDDVRPGLKEDTMYPEDMHGWYTAEQMKTTYGYDDARMASLQMENRIVSKLIGGKVHYHLVEQKPDLFLQVVLHEIGHSVDEALGKHTPPVFDFARWHSYSDATFDQWAAEMGGWDKVSGADKKAIREIWIDATRGKTAVDKLVPEDHPAMSKEYEKKGVGIVKQARAGQTMAYEDRVQIGDRVFVAGSYPDVWSSVSADAALSAPSVYSLYAPAEYFAESYVEYYKGLDGTPGSQAKKGGALPGPVKQWFDANVDKIKYDPARFKGGASDHGSDQPAKVAGNDSKQAATT
ncbi:MAG: hypothetical protein H0T46_08950 [Deltaproteobacteria bacterium]|nr:hypothetical protein [Deltaproteobacteria bacterium]